MDLDIFFNILTASLQLGSLSSQAIKIQGGLMHNMYKLATDKGIYAVKLLNPNVMQRQDALDNFQEADRLEAALEKNNIKIIPSLIFDGKKMQNIGGQYFYIYNWYEGEILKSNDITKPHCQKIGKVLASIHSIDIKKESLPPKQINVDWNSYLKLAKEHSSLIYNLLFTHSEILYTAQKDRNVAVQNLPTDMSICHNDMDCKNVLWNGEDFRIIDLECLGYSNPYLELLELSICWSGYEECSIDFRLVKAFITAYFKGKKSPCIDWKCLYYSNQNRLEWLEYNIKRALLIECDSLEEQAIGLEQVKKTMEQIIYYNNIKDELLNCLENI